MEGILTGLKRAKGFGEMYEEDIVTGRPQIHKNSIKRP
jgi:hypothetical protein